MKVFQAALILWGLILSGISYAGGGGVPSPFCDRGIYQLEGWVIYADYSQSAAYGLADGQVYFQVDYESSGYTGYHTAYFPMDGETSFWSQYFNRRVIVTVQAHVETGIESQTGKPVRFIEFSRYGDSEVRPVDGW